MGVGAGCGAARADNKHPCGCACAVLTGAGGRHHSLAFSREGEAFAWGLNQQVGRGLSALRGLWRA